MTDSNDVPRQVALDQISEARKHQEEALDLSSLALDCIPEEIGDLTQLRVLYLNDNELKHLPTTLGWLENLDELHVQSNKLVEIPPQIGKLTSLNVLDLADNQLSQLPPSLGDLSSLQTLDLSRNSLESLPPEIGRLTDLVELLLYDNSLTSIPIEFGGLKRLRLLLLQRNRIENLPHEVCRLASLESLSLDRNRLTKIPVEIGQLTSLKALELSHNLLTTLPSEIGKLRSLDRLIVHDNELTSLPSSIRDLIHLSHLNIDRNRLLTLPNEIGELRRLDYLRLSSNPLPDEILAKADTGTTALLAYMRELGAAENEAHYEVKLVFVGPGAVGKTCLLKCLQRKIPKKNQKTTYGIDIAREPLDLPHPTEAGKTLHLNCWDFGGQEVYEITHQFFFSRRSIYLVLWQPRHSNATETVTEWIELIEQRVGDSARVIVVCTHAKTDKHAKDIDARALKEKFGDIILDFVEVDTFEPEAAAPENRYGVAALRTRVAEIAGTLPEPFPAKYRAPRKALITMARDKKDDADGEGREWMRGGEFNSLAAEHDLDAEGAYELAHLMDIQGHVVFHDAVDEAARADAIVAAETTALGIEDDPRPEGATLRRTMEQADVVILKPEWLAKAIGKVLEDPTTRAASGILRHERLCDIWKDEDICVPVELHGFLLQLMDRFDVSYGLKGNGNGQSLIPQLIRSERPTGLPWTPSKPVRDDQHQLSIVFDFHEPPRGLVPIATVHTHRHRTDQSLHWQRGVFLDDNRHGTGFIELRDRELWLSTRGAYPLHFLDVLIDTIERMLSEIWPGVKLDDPRGYQLKVPCYEALPDGSPCPGRDELQTLRLDHADGIEKKRCERCRKPRQISRLLLGFASEREAIVDEFSRLVAKFDALGGDFRKGMDELIFRTWRLREINDEQLGQLAHFYKTFINAMETHRRDGPCLFSLTPTRKTAWRKTTRLTLWCEWPDGPHPCAPLMNKKPGAGQHDLVNPTPLLRKSAKAVSWMLGIIKIAAPIAGAFGKEIAGELHLDDIKANIGLMEEIVAALPSGELDVRSADESERFRATSGRPPRLGEPDLRVFHDFLREALPNRSWGNLRRAEFKGEFLWLCPHHFDQYDERRRRS